MTSLNSWPPPPLIRGCKALWNFVWMWRKTCYEVLVRSKTNRKSLPDYCTLKAGRVQGCGSADHAKVWPFVPYQRKYRWPYQPPEGGGELPFPAFPNLTFICTHEPDSRPEIWLPPRLLCFFIAVWKDEREPGLMVWQCFLVWPRSLLTTELL